MWTAEDESGVEGVASLILGLVSPLVLVLGTSLIALLLITVMFIFVVMKRVSRSKREREEQVCVKMLIV